MSLKRWLLVALPAAACAAVAGAGDGAAAGRASCGAATSFRGAPILELGPLRIAGFSNAHCAWIAPGCGPSAGGYQSKLSLELSKASASPIVLRARSSEAVKFIVVGQTTPAPKVPRCLSAGGAHAQVFLRAPKTYFVLFVFVRSGVSFHLTASRGGRRLGSAVLSCRA